MLSHQQLPEYYETWRTIYSHIRNSKSVKSLTHKEAEDLELQLIDLDSQIRLFNDACNKVYSIGNIISALEALLKCSLIKTSKKKKKLINQFLGETKKVKQELPHDPKQELFHDPLLNLLPIELFDTITQALLSDVFNGDSIALTRLIAYKNTSRITFKKIMDMLEKLFNRSPAAFFENLLRLTPKDLLRFIQAFCNNQDSLLYKKIAELAQTDESALLCLAMMTKDITKLDADRLAKAASKHSLVYVDAIVSFLKKDDKNFFDILFRRREDIGGGDQVYLNLSGADIGTFMQSNPCEANIKFGLSYMDLSFANLAGAKIENAVVTIKLKGAYLEGASLKGISLTRDHSVKKASFRGTDLAGVTGLQYCYGVDFRGARLLGAESLEINETNKIAGAVFFDKQDVVSWDALNAALTKLNKKLSTDKSDYTAVQNLLSEIANDFLRSLHATNMDAKSKDDLIKAVKKHSIIAEKRKDPKKKPKAIAASFFKPAKLILTEAKLESEKMRAQSGLVK